MGNMNLGDIMFRLKLRPLKGFQLINLPIGFSQNLLQKLSTYFCFSWRGAIFSWLGLISANKLVSTLKIRFDVRQLVGTFTPRIKILMSKIDKVNFRLVWVKNKSTRLPDGQRPKGQRRALFWFWIWRARTQLVQLIIVSLLYWPIGDSVFGSSGERPKRPLSLSTCTWFTHCCYRWCFKFGATFFQKVWHVFWLISFHL